VHKHVTVETWARDESETLLLPIDHPTCVLTGSGCGAVLGAVGGNNINGLPSTWTIRDQLELDSFSGMQRAKRLGLVHEDLRLDITARDKSESFVVEGCDLAN